MEKKITLNVIQVKSSEDLADAPSRWGMDRGDYTLDRSLFLHLMKKMKKHIHPQVDMFASPGNHQLPQFVARYPHWQAWEVNALKCPLGDIGECYANPPLENYKQVATQTKGKQTSNMYDDCTPLGFKFMVAPTNENASKGHPSFCNTPISGDVQKLLGRINATSKMAPSLPAVIRQGLQNKQVNLEAANTYLKGLKKFTQV
jgi:hypothetical protein